MNTANQRSNCDRSDDVSAAEYRLRGYQEKFDRLFNGLHHCGGPCVSQHEERKGLGIRIQDKTIIITTDKGGEHVVHILQRSPLIPCVNGEQPWMNIAEKIYNDNVANEDLRQRSRQHRIESENRIAEVLRNL